MGGIKGKILPLEEASLLTEVALEAFFGPLTVPVAEAEVGKLSPVFISSSGSENKKQKMRKLF